MAWGVACTTDSHVRHGSFHLAQCSDDVGEARVLHRCVNRGHLVHVRTLRETRHHSRDCIGSIPHRGYHVSIAASSTMATHNATHN